MKALLLLFFLSSTMTLTIKTTPSKVQKDSKAIKVDRKLNSSINVDEEEKTMMEADPEFKQASMENEMIQSDISRAEQDIERAERTVLNPVVPPKVDIPENEEELALKTDEELEAELKPEKEEIKNPILIQPENLSEGQDTSKAPLIIINAKTEPLPEENKQPVGTVMTGHPNVS